MAILIIERGSNAKGASEAHGTRRRIPLLTFPFTIGRDPGCGLVLHEEGISRRHCHIRKRGKSYIIEDYSSRNGTFLNGERIVNSLIKNGDRINLGSYELMFLSLNEDINISTEFNDLGWVGECDFGFGIAQPLHFSDIKNSRTFAPTRYDLNEIKSMKIQTDVQKIVFDSFSNVSISENLREAAKVFLKSLIKIAPNVDKASVFIWNSLTRTILPVAHWYFLENQSYAPSKTGLKDVITRGCILKISYSSADRISLILPLVHQDVILGILHLDLVKDSTAQEIADIFYYIQTVSPLFETLLLRKEMDSWLVGMVETMIATVEAKDTYTRGHSERVSKYCMAVADHLKLSRDVKRMLMISALCHDIGKIGVPDAILKKSSILSSEEYQEIKAHPELGAQIVKHMPGYQRFISGVKYHHEKWDGSGYPEGLAGEDIPFFGRIICVADVFDAMISGRSYSGFIDQGDAIEKLLVEKDLFDPQILNAFVAAYEIGSLTLKTSTAPNIPFPNKETKISDQEKKQTKKKES